MSEPREMGFLEHLEELRWVIVKSIIAVMVCAVAAFIFVNVIFDYIILAPKTPGFITNQLLCQLAAKFNTPALCINQQSFQLINITMAGQFNMHIWTSIIVGIIVAFPYIFFQFWSFIAPALHEKEQKYAGGAVIISSALFFLGVAFGYYIIVPFSVNFLGMYSVSSQILNQITLTSYISTLITTVMASGLVFELPIVVYFLTRVGILTPKFMRTYRRHAVIIILIVAAIITPPDIFSQILVSIPLLILYEVSILISAVVARKRAL